MTAQLLERQPQACLSSPRTVLLMCRLFLLANKIHTYIHTYIHTGSRAVAREPSSRCRSNEIVLACVTSINIVVTSHHAEIHKPHSVDDAARRVKRINLKSRADVMQSLAANDSHWSVVTLAPSCRFLPAPCNSNGTVNAIVCCPSVCLSGVTLMYSGHISSATLPRMPLHGLIS